RDPELTQLAHGLQRDLRVAHHSALGDLEREPLRAKLRLREDRGDLTRELRVLELARSEVHVDGQVRMVRIRELPRARLAAGLSEHRAADLDHVAELVGERDERPGPKHAVARAVPAGQRLERDERPALEVDDRLVVDAELPPL